ncbi:hypothetical protein DL767_000062 [Monosporascus sp. MG133]|nr:hypothetical protein DL767_000062 [Monosporascus sp. MG133]
MPLSRSEAPASIPDAETIESLLGRLNLLTKGRRTIKTLQELTESERERKGLVKLGVRCKRIEGDPFGVLMSWAGNVAHPEDDRIYDIMQPLLDELSSAKLDQGAKVKAIESLLDMIPTTPFGLIAEELSVKNSYKVLVESAQETVATFKLTSSVSVRLMQCHDIDKSDESSYGRTIRASMSRAHTTSQLDDPPMTKELTQHIMARLLSKGKSSLGITEDEDPDNIKNGPSNSGHTGRTCGGFFYELRKAAQEEYWYHMSSEERAATRQESTLPSNDAQFASNLETVRKNWQRPWNSSVRHPDYFRIYRLDQMAAENLLWGKHLSEMLVRCFDMWAYFTPLPAPDSCRHATDNYLRKAHPELDMSKATAATLPNARMCVAHYGSWASQNDPHGRRIMRTMDTRFARGGDQNFSMDLFAQFSRAALGKATEMIRFLMKPLDRAYYDEGIQILSSLTEEEKITTSEEDFLSLFALGVNGYTARHADKKDAYLGLAGLCTFGRYTGGHLCVPDLGFRVPYQPGACTILRGRSLEHLVKDYSGLRVFVIGTSHDTTRKYSQRKRGILPQLPPPIRETARRPEDDYEDENPMETTCINFRSCSDDDIRYTNREIHGPGALWDSSPEPLD